MLSRTPAPEFRQTRRSGPPLLDRPFYFIIVLWGERFRNYFADLCLPTLLAPGNLPALNTREPSKFLICTRPEDWAALQSTPVFRLLEQYVEPIYIEIPPCPPGVRSCLHMGIGHRRGCEMAHAVKAYPFVLTPDCIFSDGMIARLQELAARGVQLVLAPALRFAQEPLFKQLEAAGISSSSRRGTTTPITLQNRYLVRMALKSLHSETLAYEWDAPYFYCVPAAVWWRVPDEDGIVVHSLSWAPLLFDFSAVPEHDISTLDNWTFDGDYIYKNLGNIKRVHLVLDSDEIFLASWGPSSERPLDLTPLPEFTRPVIGPHLKRRQFKSAFYSGVFDPLKQQIFFRAARWHAKPINDRWRPVERRASTLLHACVAPPKEQIVSLEQDCRRSFQIYSMALKFFDEIVTLICRLNEVVRHIWSHRQAILPRLGQMLRGNPEVRAWLKWRLRELAYRLVGRVPGQKPSRPSR